MQKFTNNETLEFLILLQEECSEVIKVVSKMLRHGVDSKNPLKEDSVTNWVNLCRETKDILWVMENLNRLEFLPDEFNCFKNMDQEKLQEWDDYKAPWLHGKLDGIK